jgi:YD repeat-containing protein
MNQINKILAIVFAVQIAIVGFVYWSQTATSVVTSGPLIADFEPAEVVGLTVKDNDGNHIVLSKKDAEWVLSEAGDYPVTEDKVSTLLEKIPNITTNRLVTKTDASHKRLQVADDDFNRLLEINLADGTVHKLYLGSSGGAGAAHVRIGGLSEVYLTNEINSFEADPKPSNWINTLYFSVPQTATQHVVLENGNGTFEFERVDDETWKMKDLAKDETFNQVGLTTLLNQITSLNMNVPLGKTVKAEYGLDDPQAVVTIETSEADEPYKLEIGAVVSGDEGYYLKASNSVYYVQVAKFTGENLINKVRDDFLEKPPTESEQTQ